MTGRPTPDALYDALRRSGMSRAGARRMAAEWLDHYDDVAESLQQSDDAVLVLGTMGSVAMLAEASQAFVPRAAISLSPGHVATMQRWTGACTAGLLATLSLFAALGQLIY